MRRNFNESLGRYVSKLQEWFEVTPEVVEDCLDDYRDNAFAFDSIRSYVETQYPYHPKEFKDELVRKMTSTITEDLSPLVKDAQEQLEGKYGWISNISDLETARNDAERYGYLDDLEIINDLINKYSKKEDFEEQVCSICNQPFSGYGNNAEPINSGRCCDKCNIEKVIPARIAKMRVTKKEECIQEDLENVKKDLDSLEAYLSDSMNNYDIIDYSEGPMNVSIIVIRVEGDWKHEHLKFKTLVDDWADENNKFIYKIDEEEVGDSESDYYTADYHVYITDSKDTVSKLDDIRKLFADDIDEDYMDTPVDMCESRYNYSGHDVSRDRQQYAVTVVIDGTDGDPENGPRTPDYYKIIVPAMNEEDAEILVKSGLLAGEAITNVQLATPEEIQEWEESWKEDSNIVPEGLEEDLITDYPSDELVRKAFEDNNLNVKSYENDIVTADGGLGELTYKIVNVDGHWEAHQYVPEEGDFSGHSFILTESYVVPPEYEDGDVVFVGDAKGYHGTFLIKGDFNNIPKELHAQIRQIYKCGDANNNIYKVEYKLNTQHLFQKDYEEFFDRITPLLKDNNIEIIEDTI